MSSQLNQLVKMANQIALNFGERRDPVLATEKTREHLQKFWTRDMRMQLSNYISAGGEGVSPAVHSALASELATAETH